ncbi:reticulocyte binding protein, putative [Plasmodium relictum]|uniref:Reticulocyte binding protein, putative n=1 Tax=Plasmodium relictum TaxID=85471 RepID=A0A1J1GN98_PLARL|nr:reticulocyte binding protein, putative [Plasmodium relictum]CRG84897.1 reticulocyte binding protein, putative [Plasmodium relictum]
MWIVCFTFLYTFFGGLSYGNKFKISSNAYKSTASKLSLYLDLRGDKELYNNTKKEYNNNKRKNGKVSNFQIDKYKKKVDKLKNEDETKSYLSKNALLENMKNSIIRAKSPHLVNIKKNNPYLFEMHNIKEKKIKKELNNITNSFIQTRNVLSVPGYILSGYSYFTMDIDEMYTRVKKFYIKARTYQSLQSYFILRDYTKNKYINLAERIINELIKKTNDAINFYESARDDMRKRLNNLQQLQNNTKQNYLYNIELDEFNRKKEENIDKARDLRDSCNIINEKAYEIIKSCIVSLGASKDLRSNYKKEIENFVKMSSSNNKDHEDFLKEIENFLNTDSNIVKFKQGKFDQCNIKYQIKPLIEEISDIEAIYKENLSVIKKNQKIVLDRNNSRNELDKFQLNAYNSWEIVQLVLSSTDAFYSIQSSEEWNLKLREKFKNKKKAIYDLFLDIAKELERKINSLVYPEEVESESEKNILNSKEILNSVEFTMTENSRSLEELSNNYHSATFSGIKKDLAELYAEVIIYNNSMVDIFNSMNEKNNSNEYSKVKIKNIKNNKVSIQENNIGNTIDNLSNVKENIESEITLVNSRFNALKQNYVEIQNFKDKIDQLKTKIQEKNSEIQKLKREEDKSKKITIGEIKKELEKMNRNITYLNKIMNLKEKENEDLKIIEKLINEASCDMSKYIERKKNANEKINLALNALINNGKLEAYKEILHFVDEKKRLDYASYDFDNVNEILEEVKRKSTKIDSIISETTSIMQNNVEPEINQINQLKNDVLIKLTEDLYNKMKNSFENFSEILNSIFRSIAKYEKKKEILKSYEHHIMEKKKEFLNKFVEEDYEIPNGENILQEITDLQSTNFNEKNEINKQIINAQNIVSTLKEQLGLCKHIEIFFDNLKDTKIDNFKALKLRINEAKIDNLDEYQERFNGIVSSIENSMEMIIFLNKVIEAVKNLNNVINESNKNCDIIKELSININIIKEKIDEEIDTINKETLIEDDIKNKFLINLEDKKRAIENKKIKIDSLGEESNSLLTSSEILKEGIANIKYIGDVKPYLENALNKKRVMLDISSTINDIKVTNDILYKETDDNIKNIKTQIVELIYGHIINLNQEINNEINRNLNILNKTKQVFENFSFEINVEKDKINNSKQKINSITQKINELINKINDNKEKLIDIQRKSKEHVDIVNIIKENNKNLNDKKSDMKNHYEEIKKILDELNTVKKELESLIKDMKASKLEYERAIVCDIVQLISDEKRKSEEEMLKIDEYRNKIEELKKNSEFTENESKSFNYEEYLNKAKKNQEKIDELEKKANKLKEEASNSEIESIENIKMKVEQKIKDILIYRSEICDALNEIKSMENLLMMNQFKSIVDDLKENIRKAREENENLKSELKKSDSTKNLILDNFQKAEQLKSLIISNSEENVIDEKIDEIRKIKDVIINNIRNMGIFSIEVEKSKGASALYFHNIVRGKNKIDYLKNHNQDKEKNITKYIIEEVNGFVNESEGYSNGANRDAQTFNVSHEIISKYENKISDLLNESLILAKKIKIEKTKNDSKRTLKEIQDDYISIQKSLEKSKEKLNELSKQAKSVKKDNNEANNEKSIIALREIEMIKTDINSVLSYIEIIKKGRKHVLSIDENKVELLSTLHESEENDLLGRLKKEQNNLRNALEILKEIKDEKNLLNHEFHKLIDIESKINSIENKLEDNKKSYEEGILQEIKKLADQDKEHIVSMKNSINLMIDTSNSLFNKFKLNENDIRRQFEDYGSKMKEIENNFNESYKAIENFLVEVMKSSTSYNEAKNKRKESQKEKKNLHGKKEEMKTLLNSISNIKNILIFKLITNMKKDLNKMNELFENDYSKVIEYIKEIKKKVENIKNSDDVNVALNDLDIAKNKVSEIKEIKKIYFSYKNKADIIYGNLIEIAKFIDTNRETKPKLEDYNTINNSKEIVSKILKNLDDIYEKEKESENLFTKANSFYEQVKLREELKKIINETKQKIDETLYKIESTFDKFKKIKELSVDEIIYDEIFKNYIDHKNLKELTNSYREKSSKIKNELKIDEMKKSIDFNKKSLDYIKKTVYTTKASESSINILDQARFDIITLINNVDNAYKNTLGINSSYNELLKLGKNCKLSLLFSIVSSLDVEISKDTLIIQRKKNDIELKVEYIRNNYVSITRDISILNEYSSKNQINKYDSNNVEDVNQYKENFKEMEQRIMETIGSIKEIFLTINKKKNENDVNKSLKELKDLYKKFKNEKKDINDIYKNINNVKLKEMEKEAQKLVEISKLYKNIIDVVKEKLLDNGKKLKKIEDSIREREHELFRIEYVYAQEYIQKVNNIYEEVTHVISKISEYENNKNENNKIMKYEKHIVHLIEKTKFLLEIAELYQHENDYDLSEEENNKRLCEVNNYLESIKRKTNESKKEFENMLSNIKQTKEILFNNNNVLHDIYNITKNVNEIKENYPKKAIEQDIERKIRNHSNEIKKIINENRNEIDKGISSIQNSNGRLKRQQLIIKNVMKKIKEEKKIMDTLFDRISASDNSNINPKIKTCLEEAEKLIKELTHKIDQIENLLKGNYIKIDKLKDRNNITIKKSIIRNSKHDKQKRESGEKSNDEENGKEKNNSFYTKNKFAGAILCLFICSSAFFAAFNKHQEYNTEINNLFEDSGDNKNDNNSFDIHKEDAIDVTFIEDEIT